MDKKGLMMYPTLPEMHLHENGQDLGRLLYTGQRATSGLDITLRLY
jgi:hypothetical protein